MKKQMRRIALGLLVGSTILALHVKSHEECKKNTNGMTTSTSCNSCHHKHKKRHTKKMRCHTCKKDESQTEQSDKKQSEKRINIHTNSKKVVSTETTTKENPRSPYRKQYGKKFKKTQNEKKE